MSTGGNIESVGGVMAELGIDTAQYEAKLANARATLQKFADAITSLDKKMKAGVFAPGPEITQANQQLKQLQAVHAQVADSIKSMSSASTQAGMAMQSATSGGRGLGQTLLQLGYIADDAQYGFRGIANNIPQLFAAAGPAAMGVAALVATITNQIINHWDEVREVWRAVWNIPAPEENLSTLDRMTEAIDKLGKAAKESATAYATLAAQQKLLKEQQAATTAVEGIKPEATPQEKATGEAFQKAIGQAGGGEAFQQQVVNAFRQANQFDQFDPQTTQLQTEVQQLRARLGELRQRAAAGEGGLGPEMQQIHDTLEGNVVQRNWGTAFGMGPFGKEGELQQAITAREENARKEVDKLIAAATKGDRDAQARLTAIIQQQPELFAPGLAGQFGQAAVVPTKEAKTAQDNVAEENQRLEDQDIAADQRESARRVAEDRRKRQQAAAQQQRAFDQEVKERARQLSEGELGTSALSQNVITEADVRQRLGQAGLTPEQVEKEAGPVFAGFAQMMRDQIQGKAIAGGFGVDRARAELLSERIAKANDDPDKRRRTEDPEDLQRKLIRLQLDARAMQNRPPEFVSPAEMAAKVQIGAVQGEDKQLRAMLDIAENSAEQVKILEKIQGGVPAVAT
jgi:hypothetical protein